MYTRILVPLDGSPIAEQVLPYVRILAQAFQSPIELLRAFQPVTEEWVDPTQGRYLDQVIASYRYQAQGQLNQYMEYFQDLGVAIACTVQEGEPASHIINDAEKIPGTLIAMSTHGRSGITRWVLGSVTDKVLHATTSPLLVIRARPVERLSPEVLPTRSERWATTISINTIVAPLDGSLLAEQVLPHVVALAKGLEVKVRMVAVTSSAAEEDSEANQYLSEVGERLRNEGVPSVEAQLLHGDAGGAIVDMTERTRDSLLVMTTHGRSGVGRWVVGSVTDKVVRYCGNPVLVISPT